VYGHAVEKVAIETGENNITGKFLLAGDGARF